MREFRVKEWLEKLDESKRFGGSAAPRGARTRPGVEHRIDTILEAYRASQAGKMAESAELELRFQMLDIEQFVSAMEKLRGVRSGATFLGICRYVRFLQHAGGGTVSNTVTQFQIGRGGAVSKSSYVKHRLQSELIARDVWHRNHPFRLCHSHEVATVQDVSETASLVRLILRASFGYPAPDRDWRVDLSLVWQGEAAGNPDWRHVYRQLFARADFVKPFEIIRWLRAIGDTQSLSLKPEIEAEYVGKPAALNRSVLLGSSERLLGGLVGHITQTLDSRFHAAFHYHRLMSNIAGLLEKGHLATDRKLGIPTTRQIAPQVRMLNWSEYKDTMYPPIGFLATAKTDGVRAFAYVKDGRGYILTDKIEFTYDRRHCTRHDWDHSYHHFAKATLVDGELLDDGRFHVLDVLLLEGKRVFTQGFEQRIACVDAAIKELRHVSINACQKEFLRIKSASEPELSQMFGSLLDRHGHDHPSDGLILVEPGRSYLKTRSFKWKPPECQSIDFLAKKVPDAILGTLPNVHRPQSTLHFLFVGTDRDMDRCLRLPRCRGYDEHFAPAILSGASDYIAVPFAPSDQPQAYYYWHPDNDSIDGKIVELRANPATPVDEGGFVNWIFEGERIDRLQDARRNGYVGNNVRIAELTWRQYADPFTLGHLVKGRKDEYFHAGTKGGRSNQVLTVSAAKQHVIDRYLSRAEWVVDICAGRGQDLRRYMAAGVRNLVAVDRDQPALSELVNRKFRLARRGNRYSGTRCFVLHHDLNKSHPDLTRRVASLRGYPPGGCDAVVCNLAIHYYAGSVDSLRRFARLCTTLIGPDGYVIITLLNGEALHQKFLEHGTGPGEKWRPDPQGDAGNTVVRLYREEELLPAGQQIALKLPFSGGRFYREFLVNTEALVAVFDQCSLNLAERRWASAVPGRRKDAVSRSGPESSNPDTNLPYETLVFRFQRAGV